MTGQSGRHGPDSVDDFTGLRMAGVTAVETLHARMAAIKVVTASQRVKRRKFLYLILIFSSFWVKLKGDDPFV